MEDIQKLKNKLSGRRSKLRHQRNERRTAIQLFTRKFGATGQEVLDYLLDDANFQVLRRYRLIQQREGIYLEKIIDVLDEIKQLENEL